MPPAVASPSGERSEDGASIRGRSPGAQLDQVQGNCGSGRIDICGNVPELENCIERTATMVQDDTIPDVGFDGKQNHCLTQALQSRRPLELKDRLPR